MRLVARDPRSHSQAIEKDRGARTFHDHAARDETMGMIGL